MKKVIVLILLIIIGAGSYMYLSGKLSQSKISPEDLLADNPLVYVKLSNISANLEKIQSTTFWQKISSIDYERILSKGKLSPSAQMVFSIFQEQLTENKLIADRLFDREVVFAFYEFDADIAQLPVLLQTSPEMVMEDYLSSMAIVLRMPPDVQAAEYVSRYYEKISQSVTTETQEYNGHEIRIVKLNDLGVETGYTVINDLLVWGVTDKVAKNAIDVYEGKINSLAQSDQYKMVSQQFLDSSAVSGFVKFEQIMSGIKEIALSQLSSFVTSDVSKEQLLKNMELSLSQGDGLETMIFSTQIAPVIKSQFNVVTNTSRIHPQYKPFYQCPSTENASLAYAPEDLMGYLWTNCLNLPFYWEQYQKQLTQKSDGSATNPLAQIESALNMSIAYDVLPAFGSQFGIYLNDISVGIFPIPELTLFIEVKDRVVVEKLLSNLDEVPLLTFVDENYKGADFKFVPLPVANNIKPAYGFVDKYLFISTNFDFVKRMMDAKADRALSLINDGYFKNVNFGLTDKNRDVQFFRVGAFARKFDDVVGWSNQWVTDKEQQQKAFFTGSQQRLNDVRFQIQQAEIELESVELSSEELKNDIIADKKLGLETSVKELELEDLQKQKGALEADLLAYADQEFELIQIVEGYEEQGMGSDLRSMYLDELIYPLLDSLGSISAYGSRATLDGSVIKSGAYLSVE